MRRASDADASCFLGRCYMGEGFVRDGAGFTVDEDEAARLIKESVLGESADGVLCVMRTGNLSPEVQENMPFDSLKEAFMIVKQRALENREAIVNDRKAIHRLFLLHKCR